MKIYAYIIEGFVKEIVQPFTDEDGNEVPVEKRFTEDFIKSLQDISTTSPKPKQGWMFKDNQFKDPTDYQNSEKELNNQQIENLRKSTYSDPINGSDRFFIEALSLQAQGISATSAEVKDIKAKGLARKEEIKSEYKYSSENQE